MAYKVVVTEDAEIDLDKFVSYLLFNKGNAQAAENLLNDFEATKNRLEDIAGALKLCENKMI